MSDDKKAPHMEGRSCGSRVAWELERVVGFEPTTNCLEGRDSRPLSYTRTSGAASRNRTGDILLTRQLLYLLSYRGRIGRRYRDRTCEALIPNEVAYRLPNLRGRYQQSEPVLVAVVVAGADPDIDDF